MTYLRQSRWCRKSVTIKQMRVPFPVLHRSTPNEVRRIFSRVFGFIACSMPMHAERDRILLSQICPSVRMLHADIVYERMHTSSNCSPSDKACIIIVFLSATDVTRFQRRGKWGKICDFRHKSLFISETVRVFSPWLLRITNRKS